MDLLSIALLVASVAAFFGGIAIVVANVAQAGLGRVKVTRSLQAIDTVYGAAVGDPDARGGPVFGNRVARLGRAATSPTALARLRRRLNLAGNPPNWTVDRIFELKGLGLICLGIIGVILGVLVFGAGGAVAGGLAGAAAGYFAPDVVVYDLAERRQDQIRRTLPDIIDTLVVSVEAGLGFDAALAQVTRYGRGPLAGEFARVLQEIQIGRSRVEALRALGERTSVVELRAFCSIVVQATELGVPMATVLREQSSQMRVRRRQRAEELAQKVPVKILFPLIFCLLPPLFIVVLGPGVLNIIDLIGR
ncbi:MAG TPA: type II secretion system F family protein [Micromonosporaceae bacterium]|nr:type II secretion system F family protein [Micromonosporaceae bacterium]